MAENKDYWKKLLGDDFDDVNETGGLHETTRRETPSVSDDTRVIHRPSSDSAHSPSEMPRSRQTQQTGNADDTRPLSTAGFESAGKPRPTADLSGAKKSFSPAPQRKASEKGSDGEEFQINFDFEKEYSDEPDPPLRPVRRHREKRTGCLGGFFYFAFILAASILLACGGWIAAVDVLGLSNDDVEIEVTVPKEYTMDDVVDTLFDKGLIQYKKLFMLYSKFSHADEKIESGTYMLNTNYDYRALVYGMTPAEGRRVEIKVTIPEGYNLTQIIQLLAEKKVCEEDELWEAATSYRFKGYDFLPTSTIGKKFRMEGFLFPDTYTFYVGDDPARVLDKMLYNFECRWISEYQAQAEYLGYSMEDVIKVASIIEKEAAGNGDRAYIASVIYNRIENYEASSAGYLGLDSTVHYACDMAGVPFDTEYDSPYNTYLYQGLPVGAISNPGIAAIKAALYPEDTDYYYFALGVDGTHHFFSDYYSFEEFVYSDEYAG